MKKLRLNKFFHWLYAILMLYPFINFIFTVPIFWFTGFDSSYWVDDMGIGLSQFIEEFIPNFEISNLVGHSIYSVWSDLVYNVFGINNVSFVFDIVNMLTYWTIVSLFYLLFDVLMYPINLFHKWIDEGGI